MRVWRRAVLALSIGIIAAVVVPLALIATDAPQVPEGARGGIDFHSALSADNGGLPDLRPHTARDAATLHARHYGQPAEAEKVVVMLHGSGWHGMQFHKVASALEAAGHSVLVPDLRGHGPHPVTRGDLTYLGQFEDDLADLVRAETRAGAEITLLGHSSGGGLVARAAGGEHGALFARYVMIAPFLQHDAPTTKPNSGGWAHVALRRIIGLSILNAFGVHAFDHLPVIAFAMPEAVTSGPYGHTATLSYSWRLNQSFAPRRDYARDIAAMEGPFLVIAGAEDEAFHALRYEPVLSAHNPRGTYVVLPGAGHIDVLQDERMIRALMSWLERPNSG